MLVDKGCPAEVFKVLATDLAWPPGRHGSYGAIFASQRQQQRRRWQQVGVELCGLGLWARVEACACCVGG